MFFNCVNLRSLDLSDFHTPKLKTMECMFDNDISLIGLDLSNFDTSLVTNMDKLFNNCRELIYLNLNNFNDTNNPKMDNFFPFGVKVNICIDEEKAPRIASKFIDLNSLSVNDCGNTCFTESKKIVTNERKCVDECEKSIYPYEFDNICYKTIPDEYLNQTDQNDDNNPDDYMSQTDFADLDESDINKPDEFMSQADFEDLSEDKNTIQSEVSEKIDENEKTDQIEENTISSEISEKSDENNNAEESSKNNESDKSEENPKANVENNSEKNIESDKNSESNSEKTEETFKNDESDKSDKTEESNHLDESDKTEEFEGEINSNVNLNLGYNQNSNGTLFKKNLLNDFPIINENFSKFSSEDFFNNFNTINNEDLPNKDEIILNIKEDIINGNLNSSLTDLITGRKEDLLIELEDISYQITTTKNQRNNTYNNISTINLGDCENILRRIYGIKDNLSLIILKIEYKMEGILIPVIGYEVYHPLNFTQLDLNYCNDTLVTLNIPVVIDEDNAFKYDPNSDYYNDECYAYATENGADIILSDRIKEYTENNLSLCENNCSFNGYDSNTKKALCECETKIKINLISEIIKEENILSNNFSNSDNSNSNIDTIKCISLLFSKNGLLTNIGSYILFLTIGLFGVSIFIFYKCGYELIGESIKEMVKLKKKY